MVASLFILGENCSLNTQGWTWSGIRINNTGRLWNELEVDALGIHAHRPRLQQLSRSHARRESLWLSQSQHMNPHGWQSVFGH
jgi:hypothetical protein